MTAGVVTAGAPTLRGRKVVMIVGAPESGKTTLSRGFLDALKADKSDKRPLAIIDPGAQFRGGSMPVDVDAWLETVRPPNATAPAKVRGILFDDCDSYLEGAPTKYSARSDLYLRHRWWRTDVIVTCRRPQNMHPKLLSAISMLYVFRMSSGDTPAVERLEKIAPGLVVPTEPYLFQAFDVYQGKQRLCRTLPRGGFEVA